MERRTTTAAAQLTSSRAVAYGEAGDEHLTLASILGDLRAFDELIRRYRAAVVVTAEPIVGCRAAAEDVAQEAFLLAFKALPQLEEPSRFAGWLRAIARRVALRTRERQGRAQPVEMTRLDALVCAGSRELTRTDPARVFADKAEDAAFWQAVAGLAPEHREVLLLRGRDGWPLLRIAAFLDLSEDTVRGRLYRARVALRKALIQE